MPGSSIQSSVHLAAAVVGYVLCAIAASSTACGQSQTNPAKPYVWVLPPWIQPPPVPADNPMSEAKVALGRRVFYDIRLAGPSYMSCATCHDPKRAFTEQRPVSFGITGDRATRNAPSLANVGYAKALTWDDPSVNSLEIHARRPLFNEKPAEMALTGHEVEVLNHFAFNPVYKRMHAEAFPEQPQGPTIASLIKALASFQRTLISANAPYDRYRYAGDRTALSASARRGEALFFGPRLKCGQCHTGQHLTDALPQPQYHNTGLYAGQSFADFTVPNQGLARTTGQDSDLGKFRTPSLRNVAATAPYMHDGSIADLNAVIDHYAAGGRAAGQGQPTPWRSASITGFTIMPGERADLIAFLDSLTDTAFLTSDRHTTPFR